MFRSEPEPWRGQADRVSALACDISEFLARFGYAPTRDSARADGGLSFRLQPAAWPAGHRRTEGAAAACGLHRGGTGGGAYLLRFGRHLQHAAAGDRRAAARAQARQPARHRCRPDRRRQYRLHHPACRRRTAGRAHGRVARLDGGWSDAVGSPSERSPDACDSPSCLPPCCSPRCRRARRMPAPPGNDRRAAIDKLLGALKSAPSEEIAGPLEQQIRQLWLNSGTPAVTLLMSRGLREMKADAQQDAIEDFSAAITLDPNLAEAYHQRAIARFAAGDTPGAIADIQATLQHEPRSFAAFADACRDRRGAQGLEGRLCGLAEGAGDRSEDPRRPGAPEGPAPPRAGRGGVAAMDRGDNYRSVSRSSMRGSSRRLRRIRGIERLVVGESRRGEMLRRHAVGDQQLHHGDGARHRQLPVGRERGRPLDRLPVGVAIDAQDPFDVGRYLPRRCP